MGSKTFPLAAKEWLLFLLFIFLLDMAACSLIYKSSSLQPETVNGWRRTEREAWGSKETMYEFNRDNVSLAVVSLHLGDNPLAFGPPFIPLVPLFLIPGRDSNRLLVRIYIENPTQTISIDSSKIRVHIVRDGSLQVTEVDCPGFQGNIGETITVSKGKAECIFTFKKFPPDVEEILLDFGNVHINGDDVKLPPLSCRKVTRYGYHPFTSR